MPITWTETLIGTASQLGSRFPIEEVGCQVFSCSRSSINILDRNGSLLTLVAYPRQLHPRSAVVEQSLAGNGFLAWQVKYRQAVHIDGEKIAFEGGKWVSLLKAKRVPPDAEVPHGEGRIDWPRIYDYITILKSLQQKKHTQLQISSLLEQEGNPTFFSSVFKCLIARLYEGFLHQDFQATLQATEKLLGLGPGSTPAGDDFICGFLLFLAMLSGKETTSRVVIEPAFTSQYREKLKHVLLATNLTTAISKQFLLLGCEGLFAQSLVQLGNACISPQRDTTQFVESLLTLDAMGHSSGLDVATGLLLGLLVSMPVSIQRRGHELPVFLHCGRNAG